MNTLKREGCEVTLDGTQFCELKNGKVELSIGFSNWSDDDYKDIA